MTISSKEATAYLIDPLNAPEPSQETGPGTHFYPPAAAVTTPTRTAASSPSSPSPSSSNPYRKSPDSKTGAHAHAHAHVRHSSKSSTGSSSRFPAYRDPHEGSSHSRSGSGDFALGDSTRPRRTSSLSQRYPGDTSNKPLDMLRKDSKKAYRSPHLSKRHLPGPDTIDRLDPVPGKFAYHHEGPYDAALLARNTSYNSSPVAALEDSNREALKATPAENIKDALDKHRPLDGVAIVPPGQPDQLGRVYNYEEGTDMMREADPPGGPYGRYEGVEYSEGDLEGQGEPSFSLDRALKKHTIHERDFDGHRGIELSDRPLMSDYDKQKDSKKLDDRDPVEIAGGESRYAELQTSLDVNAHVSRTSSLRKAGEGLKKRLSLRKRQS